MTERFVAEIWQTVQFNQTEVEKMVSFIRETLLGTPSSALPSMLLNTVYISPLQLPLPPIPHSLPRLLLTLVFPD